MSDILLSQNYQITLNYHVDTHVMTVKVIYPERKPQTSKLIEVMGRVRLLESVNLPVPSKSKNSII